MNVILWLAMLTLVISVIFLVTAPKYREYSIEDTYENANSELHLLSKAEIADVLLDDVQITISYQLKAGHSLGGYELSTGIDADGEKVLDLRLYKTGVVKKTVEQVTIDLSHFKNKDDIRILTQVPRE